MFVRVVRVVRAVRVFDLASTSTGHVENSDGSDNSDNSDKHLQIDLGPIFFFMFKQISSFVRVFDRPSFRPEPRSKSRTDKNYTRYIWRILQFGIWKSFNFPKSDHLRSGLNHFLLKESVHDFSRYGAFFSSFFVSFFQIVAMCSSKKTLNKFADSLRILCGFFEY